MFLAPGYLWLLIFAVPLIWRHLSSQTLTLKVSSITFWRASSEDGIKLRRPSTLNFRLLTELLVLLLIVLAASQFTGDSGNRIAAVVLDNSPSMRLRNVDGKDRLTKSHAAARQALNSLPESEHVGLFLPGFGKAPRVHGFPVFVGDLIGQWQPYAEFFSVSQSLQDSINWLGTKEHFVKELYYFGDEAISHWTSVPEGIRLVPVTNTAFAPNYAVLGITAKRRAGAPEVIEIRAQLGYLGVQQTGLAEWRLKIDGQIIRDGSSNLENGRTAITTISLPGYSDAQTVTLTLEAADSCPADDYFQAEIEIEHPAKVYVSDSYQDLRSAVKAVPGVHLVDSADRESAQVWISMEETEARPLLRFFPQSKATFNFDGRGFFQKKHPILEGVDLFSPDFGFFVNLVLEEGAEALAGSGDSTFLKANPAGRTIHAGFDPVSSGFIDQPGFPILITNALRWFNDCADHNGNAAEQVAALDPIRPPLHEFRSEPVRAKYINLPLWAISASLALLFALLHWRKS